MPEQAGGFVLEQAGGQPAHREISSAISAVHFDVEAAAGQFGGGAADSDMLQRHGVGNEVAQGPGVGVGPLEVVLVDGGLQLHHTGSRCRGEHLVHLVGDEIFHRDQLVDEFGADLQGAGLPRAVLAHVHAGCQTAPTGRAVSHSTA